ncbi:MAG: RNA polymerase sigma factor [Opitutales bacterium]|nr:RNA polymerase sigma factor [Opitutales bacterium]
MTEDPDRILLQSIAEGDEKALRELMLRHQEKLFHFAYRFVLNESDAAEIVSETFVRVHRKASQFRPRAKVRTWIDTIAGNLCRDHQRREKRRRFFSLFSSSNGNEGDEGFSLLDKIPAKDLPADEDLLRTETHGRLLQQIHSLPTKLKIPFILHILEEHSQRECAEILKVSEKTVETRIYRARKRLQEALSDQHIPNNP